MVWWNMWDGGRTGYVENDIVLTAGELVSVFL